jgi:hypothetical protein
LGAENSKPEMLVNAPESHTSVHALLGGIFPT